MNKFLHTFATPLVVLGTAELMADHDRQPGTVKDAAGESLAGVNIVVKGSSSWNHHDIQGNYSL